MRLTNRDRLTHDFSPFLPEDDYLSP
jgi:hypothetical protein